MQNIDPVYFIQPIIVILFSIGLVVFWHFKRSFTRAVLFYSFLAYAGAIAIKVVFQNFTFVAFQAHFANNPWALGLYFGVQTMLLEVGGAFLVAVWAIHRGKLECKDAESYGLGLAMWENAVLLGFVGLVNLIVIYVSLSIGGPTGQEFYSSLIQARPDLFYPGSQALTLIAYGLLERVTSLLFHFCWGYLCLIAAYLHKRQYFLLALPMGLLDFFVPFEPALTLPVFEITLFILGLAALGLTLFATLQHAVENA